MGTEGETEVDDDGRGLDEGGDKQSCFVGGVFTYFDAVIIVRKV